MPTNSKRAQEIDAYISNHDCARGKQKVVINGQVRPLESYSIPWIHLQYNHENSRFNLEIAEEETRIGRKLDPTDSDDVKKIKELLLLDENEAKKLKDDLVKIGEQTEVAAITFDGIVVNGNRRMATLEKLHEDEPTGKWENLWVVRLPHDISESDLWKIEAGMQLSKAKVADYGPVNNLLMIAEGKKAGLSNAEIAASMYGWTEKQVAIDLERLNLIEVFLDFFGQPRNFGLIKKFRLHQHFIELQKSLVDPLNSSGVSAREKIRKLHTAFLYLRGTILQPETLSITYHQVRSLGKILQDPDATSALEDSFSSYKKDVRKVPFEKLAENFDKAVDVRKDKSDKDKPGKLVDRAITALNNIDRTSAHYKTDPLFPKKLKSLSEIVEQMKTDIGLS